jgi:cytidine deaminase
MPRAKRSGKNFTGERLSSLEPIFKRAADENSNLNKIFEALIVKNQDSISPISNAAFSAIMLFKSGKIFCGANVDPEEASLLKFPEHRNCAEKQAALAALSESEKIEDLKQLFLYRRPDKERKRYAEMFLPCLVCNKDYLKHIFNNEGSFFLLLNDDRIRDFIEGKNRGVLKKISINGETFFYTEISGEDLLRLKKEKSLGSSHS